MPSLRDDGCKGEIQVHSQAQKQSSCPTSLHLPKMLKMHQAKTSYHVNVHSSMKIGASRLFPTTCSTNQAHKPLIFNNIRFPVPFPNNFLKHGSPLGSLDTWIPWILVKADKSQFPECCLESVQIGNFAPYERESRSKFAAVCNRCTLLPLWLL